ncbi:AI-2E family transporter [Ornithinimicrobium cerasi]|uniref:Predicted PurR-regulated permease PerM n=1 Tax=Ornithinimicrobium cerasi TaxID=2248773 RepID=A0A285VV07_9MICO|nr:AI-2E family transporter [Ornithinimicrobium cerasi]SOC57793.1 Predicted PurR-regulated permease PerM [Ornithinimicrobium cerasi]
MPLLPALRRRPRQAAPPQAPAGATPDGRVPAGRLLPRGVVVLLGVALAFGVLLGLHELRSYVAPVFLALNLVIAAAPLQALLRRSGVPTWLAAAIAALSVFAFLIAFFGALGWSVARLVEELPRYQEQFEALYQQVLDLLAGFGIEEATLTDQLRSALNPEAIVGALGGVVGNVGGVVALLATTLIVTVFLMVDTLSAGRRLDLVREQHPRLADALAAFAHGVQRYWLVTTIFGLIVAALDVVALSLLGVPLALTWGVLAFVTNYIPNVGFVIGLFPPAVMALLANGPTNALIVVVVYTVINFVVQSLIQPKFTGDAVGVTPTVTFVSLVLWAWVLGPIGALLALPATLVVKALLVDADPQARWLNAFFASDPDTARAETTRDAVLQQP